MTVAWRGRAKTAYVGVGYAGGERRWDETPERALGTLAISAAKTAIADAGMSGLEIDAVFSSPVPLGGNWAPRPIPVGVAERWSMSDDTEDGISKVTAAWMARNLGLEASTLLVDTPDMFSLTNAAVDALLSGRCTTALVFRALPNFAGRYQHSGGVAAAQVEHDLQFELPFGFAGPSYHAMYFQRYLWKYGVDHREMANFAIRNRRNGLKCAYGFYAKHRPQELSVEEYLNGRWIIEPLSIHDCDLPIMVGAAFILTTAERAKDLKQHPIYVVEQAHFKPVKRSTSYTLEDFEESNSREAKAVWTKSGITTGDVDFAQLYDGYLSMTPLWAEAFGFCGPGEGIKFLTSPDAELDGRLPINTSGGNNGAGRSHGASHIYDAVLQLRGQATGHQVADAALSLVQVGPPIAWGCQLLSRDVI